MLITRNTQRKFSILAAVTLFILVSCSTDNSSQATKDDIRESIFRYQFRMEAIYCISVEQNKDPSKEFMERFKNHNPPVKPGSECSIAYDQGDRPGRVIDRKSGKNAISYSINSIKLKVWKRAEVVASWARGGLWGESHRYLLKYQNGNWVVIDDELLSVS